MKWWNKRPVIQFDSETAMKMAVCADRDLRYGGSEEEHDRNILAVAKIAKLNERLAQLEKEVFG